MDAVDLLSVLPRVTILRELLAAMGWGNTKSDRIIGYDFPWFSIAYSAERRTLFDLGGDHDVAFTACVNFTHTAPVCVGGLHLKPF